MISLYLFASFGRISPEAVDLDFFSDLIRSAISCGRSAWNGLEYVTGGGWSPKGTNSSVIRVKYLANSSAKLASSMSGHNRFTVQDGGRSGIASSFRRR